MGLAADLGLVLYLLFGCDDFFSCVAELDYAYITYDDAGVDGYWIFYVLLFYNAVARKGVYNRGRWNI